MSHRTRALGLVLLTILLQMGCASAARDQRMSGAQEPPAVPAPGALIGPPTGWRTLTQGPAPVPIAGHRPVTATGVVASFDPATEILRFEDGRLVKLTGQSTVVQPVANAIRVGDLVVLQEVLPVGVQSGVKILAVGQPQRMGTVAAVDESRSLLRLTDGTLVRVTGSTSLHLGAAGSSVALAQLSPGDELLIVLGDAGAASRASGSDGAASPSALVRQDASPAVEAAEVMVFRVPRRP